MEPEIVERPETVLVGMVSRGEDICELWNRFTPMEPRIADRIEGIWYEFQAYPDGHQPGEPFYCMAAVAVTEIESLPDELFVKPLPSGRYAVFTHCFADGGYDVLNKSIRDWLDESPYRMTGGASIQMYDSRWKGPGNPGSVVELMIPVAEK